MDTNLIEKKNQTTNSDRLGNFTPYFNQFKVGTLLNRFGIINSTFGRATSPINPHSRGPYTYFLINVSTISSTFSVQNGAPP
jgi:hypothetical protein